MQRELPWGLFVEAAYVGTRGYDLSIAGEGGLSLNQLDPQYMALGSQLNQQVANPFYGIVNNGVLTSPTVSRGQLLRPYPQFTDIVPLYAAGAKSRYNALQLTGRKRLSRGLMFEGSYTFAKAEEIGMNHQNSYDIEASWALASYDINHRFVLSYLYEIPVGRNRRFFADAPTVVNAMIGGWQFNGITTFQAGTPLSITANNTAGTLRRADAAEQHRRGPAPGRAGRGSPRPLLRHERLQPAGGVPVRQRADLLADAPRARRPQRRPLALQELRRSRLALTAQFRVEALNAFNRVQFSAPNTSVTSVVVRRDHRAGQRAAAAAVRRQAALVTAPHSLETGRASSPHGRRAAPRAGPALGCEHRQSGESA